MTYTLSMSTLMFGAALAIAPLSFADAPRQGGFSQTFTDSTAGPTTEQREVSGLLKEISAGARQASVHADQLKSFVRRPYGYSWKIHASELNFARDKINAKGKALERLKELRSEAQPWQQLAIDRVQPLLASLAENTSTAIELLNEDRRNVGTPEYSDAISNMYVYADDVREMIAVKLDYAASREALNEFEATPANR